MILLELFLSFAQVSLFSIGGGYAAIPLIRSQAVDLHGWLTAGEFLDLATIAEMTPGPIGINAATFVGVRVAGAAGAAAATFGFVLPSLILVSLLSWAYLRWRELRTLKSVLAALRPAVVALIAAAGVRMLLQIGLNGDASPDRAGWAAMALTGTALFVLRRFRAGPIPVIVLCGAGGLLLGLLGVF